ncbi:MAG: 2,3,4,5-tetrahydropyridine-2,6-dicarboxylate N-succinyltransferase [Acidiferrobacterales bacterium]
MNDIQKVIEQAFERHAEINPRTAQTHVKDAVYEAIDLLDSGQARVAEKKNGQWVVNNWLNKAVLLYFRMEDNSFMRGGYTNYFDKVPSKFADYNSQLFRRGGFRIVPLATTRKGAYIGPGVVQMPSYINIGAYIDEGTMIDTWAHVGSCAQVGKNVHISGGVEIGGVLEPVLATTTVIDETGYPDDALHALGTPTVVEDNCFIGARSVIMDGVIVEAGSVIAMGVSIDQSTCIYNRLTDEISYGRVPSGSVVVPGSLPTDDGKCNLYCAVITKRVDEATRAKVSINQLLRDI